MRNILVYTFRLNLTYCTGYCFFVWDFWVPSFRFCQSWPKVFHLHVMVLLVPLSPPSSLNSKVRKSWEGHCYLRPATICRLQTFCVPVGAHPHQNGWATQHRSCTLPFRPSLIPPTGISHTRNKRMLHSIHSVTWCWTSKVGSGGTRKPSSLTTKLTENWNKETLFSKSIL